MAGAASRDQALGLVPVGPLGLALLPVAVLFWLAAWGVIAMAWICAEVVIFATSGAVVLAQPGRAPRAARRAARTG